MKIGVCAWGSLVWDPRTLRVSACFEPMGPGLSIEFSRISGRDGRRRLTLVIDEDHGALCRTFVASSAFSDLGAAIDNLKVREGLYSIDDVGWAVHRSGAVSERSLSRHPSAVMAFQHFLANSDFDAMIWTALPPNFATTLSDGAAFSLPRALRFLVEDLSLAERDLSLEYLRRAPAESVTPLRTAASAIW